MTLRPKSIGFDRCGTLTCFPMHRMACDLCEGRLPPERMHLFVKDRRPSLRRGDGLRLQAVGGAPHTMPPAIRKTAVLTKRPRVIEAYTRSPGAPMHLSH